MPYNFISMPTLKYLSNSEAPESLPPLPQKSYFSWSKNSLLGPLKNQLVYLGLTLPLMDMDLWGSNLSLRSPERRPTTWKSRLGGLCPPHHPNLWATYKPAGCPADSMATDWV